MSRRAHKKIPAKKHPKAPFRVYVKIALMTFSIAFVIGGLFLLLLRDSPAFAKAKAAFLNSEIFYAELATSSTQGIPAPSPAATVAYVPIVVYHIVRPAYPSDSIQVRNLAQTPEVFDAQMKYLHDAGYHVVSFSDLEENLRTGAPLPAEPIVISFDDGWSDQFAYAFPILEKYHYPATFFVFTNPIGTRGFLTWNNLRALRDAGMTIGSHTLSHPYLTAITDTDALWDEIAKSKRVLELHLGIVVHEFAYPFGQYNPSIVEMVKEAGYRSARGDYLSGEQSSDHLYTLGALNAPTTLELFMEKFPAHEAPTR